MVAPGVVLLAGALPGDDGADRFDGAFVALSGRASLGADRSQSVLPLEALLSGAWQ
jgi:hypothetical protein